MSTAGTAAGLRNLVPFRAGHDPRRQVGPKLSPAEIEFKAALEAEHIPKASALLAKMYDAAMLALEEGDIAGGSACAERFFKVCGLIKKPSDDAAIQETAKALLGEMIAEAKARREQPGSAG